MQNTMNRAFAESVRRGSIAEDRFIRLCSRRRYRVRHASSYEDRVLHYDFIVNSDRVEVKSIKSARRGMHPDPSIIYVELRNIVGGPGWLYGSSDHVAFEQPRGFLMVPTKSLRRYVESIKHRLPFSSMSGIHHTLYSRRGRDDLVVILSNNEIKRLPGTFLID